MKDPIKWDYCWKEAIASMLEFCDKVVILDAGSSDGAKEELKEWASKYGKLNAICYPPQKWDEMHGKEKLSFFQNEAISFLDTDYQFLCQADEIVHENSYEAIREAINTGEEAFLCSRINLWGSPYMRLSVPQNRKPCSTEVIRLSKTGCLTVGDGESINARAVINFVDSIRIYHMGFVRDKNVMKDKITHMQESVFEIDHDPRLDATDIFDWRSFFSDTDITPISEPLPRLIQDWARQRE